MKAWGFKYKTVAFTWVKTNKKSPSWFVGLGYYTRANPEICILGIRGKAPAKKSCSVRQLVVNPIGDHSTKPPCVRERIVELFGDVPRIELFARQKVEGWDSWGHGVTGDAPLCSLVE